MHCIDINDTLFPAYFIVLQRLGHGQGNVHIISRHYWLYESKLDDFCGLRNPEVCPKCSHPCKIYQTRTLHWTSLIPSAYEPGVKFTDLSDIPFLQATNGHHKLDDFCGLRNPEVCPKCSHPCKIYQTRTLHWTSLIPSAYEPGVKFTDLSDIPFLQATNGHPEAIE
ncbi:hypothetical protein CHS0354_039556 [Potamilus streckersoni]|uniref:Uncharacterized protein n=1 Tax=Potamilus streckersoni TaxID=2493646 RepID=A0AAE0W1D3_9BIVA|nr:hypothetical protein CHS0354_039556 [Potamilus streckersoni]